ncbi:hypothetical protein QBC46DRAFT_76903 [Diplogelasinospora grovesii]|uniref:Uncharacterized protein n=1 Tax=Diplogelasinospora grovesii TaxID=303347 RepID=A0AAN6MVW8_9PEZI|nr:hypothetical protein QBC46DRAFT_76903 [Diplogelasinospora grovesii]
MPGSKTQLSKPSRQRSRDTTLGLIRNMPASSSKPQGVSKSSSNQKGKRSQGHSSSSGSGSGSGSGSRSGASRQQQASANRVSICVQPPARVVAGEWFPYAIVAKCHINDPRWRHLDASQVQASLHATNVDGQAFIDPATGYPPADQLVGSTAATGQIMVDDDTATAGGSGSSSSNNSEIKPFYFVFPSLRLGYTGWQKICLRVFMMDGAGYQMLCEISTREIQVLGPEHLDTLYPEQASPAEQLILQRLA